MHESSEEEVPMSDVASKVLSTLQSLSRNMQKPSLVGTSNYAEAQMQTAVVFRSDA